MVGNACFQAKHLKTKKQKSGGWWMLREICQYASIIPPPVPSRISCLLLLYKQLVCYISVTGWLVDFWYPIYPVKWTCASIYITARGSGWAGLADGRVVVWVRRQNNGAHEHPHQGSLLIISQKVLPAVIVEGDAKESQVHRQRVKIIT